MKLKTVIASAFLAINLTSFAETACEAENIKFFENESINQILGGQSNIHLNDVFAQFPESIELNMDAFSKDFVFKLERDGSGRFIRNPISTSQTISFASTNRQRRLNCYFSGAPKETKKPLLIRNNQFLTSPKIKKDSRDFINLIFNVDSSEIDQLTCYFYTRSSNRGPMYDDNAKYMRMNELQEVISDFLDRYTVGTDENALCIEVDIANLQEDRNSIVI